MKIASDWSIGQRLFAGFAIVAALLGLSAAAISKWQREGAAAQAQFVQHILPASERAVELDQALSQLSVALRAHLLAPDVARGRSLAESIQEARVAWRTVEQAPRDPAEVQAVREVGAAVGTYIEEAAGAVGLASAEAGEALEAPLLRLRTEATERAHALVAVQRERAREAAELMEASRERVTHATLGAYALVGSILLLLGLYIAASIRAPARRLTGVAGAIREGHWSAALALAPQPHDHAGEPRDELARIGLAFGSAAQALERREQRLKTDAVVAQAACSGHDAQQMATAALAIIADAVGASVGAVYGVDEETGRLQPLAMRGLVLPIQSHPPGEGLPGRAVAERRPLVERGLPADKELRVHLGVESLRPRAVAAVPVMLGDEVLAVLVLATLRDFDEAHLELVDSAAVQLALGLNNARSHLRLRETNEEIQAQSEELQAQGEELQAQGEELQAQNEELQRRAERLAEADRNKNHFLGLLAHELRNPLGAIANSLFVLERGSLDERGTRSLGVIQRQMRHATRLIDDLLDITRVAHGKLRIAREPLDLAELVRECVQDARSNAANAGLALEARIAPGPIHVSADRTRIAQVIDNLLGNAIKFCDQGSTVRVDLERLPESDHARITVRDDGAGIEPDLLGRLFQPFSQGRTVGARASGLGLGLALSRALVELHGGRIEAHSDGPGKGSTFVVTLPLAHVAPRLPAEELAAPRPSRRRILVIEDNPDSAETMRLALEIEGHEVDLASDGISGLEKARTLRPDVVLCDLGIPGLDGYEVARRVRAAPELTTASLIALSGYAMEEDRARSAASGFDAHLAKPVEMRALGELIARLCASRARVSAGA